MAGNLNSDGIIWVVGEATGRNNLGVVGQALPESNNLDIQAELDALEARLTASGYLAGF